MQIFQEPVWTDSEKIETKCVNSLYSLRNPYMLTGFLTQWIRAIFKRPENINNDFLKGYVWDEDAKVSRITVAPSFKNDSETERRRPAVYIKRGSVSQSTPGMKGGLHTVHVEDDGYFRGKELSTILSGGHDFQCLGDTEAEAENIGLEVFDNLLKFSAAIKEAANLGVFWVEGMGATSHDPNAKDYWICVIKTKWHYTYNWTLDRDTPILKDIAFSPVL